MNLFKLVALVMVQMCLFSACGSLSKLSEGLAAYGQYSLNQENNFTNKTSSPCKHVVKQHPGGHPCIHSYTVSTTDISGTLYTFPSGPTHESDPCDHLLPLHPNGGCVVRQTISELKTYIEKVDENFQNWYVGVCKDPKSQLFIIHAVNGKG